MRGRGALQLEVFRDTTTPDVPLDDVLAGLDTVQNTIDCIEVINDGRLIQAARPSSAVSARYIPRSDIHTDIALVVTGRDIFSDSPRDRRAIWAGNTFQLMSRLPVAISAIRVSPDEPSNRPALTVPHELGHAFEINSHCKNTECIMFWSLQRLDDDATYCHSCTDKAKNGSYNLRFSDGIRRLARRSMVYYGF